MKNWLNAKTTGWVYIALGGLILVLQLSRFVQNGTFDWFRGLAGATFLIIGIVRLVRYKPVD